VSIDLVVSALDLSRFQSAQNSKDEELLQLVLTTKELEIASHDEYFRDWVAAGRYQSLGVAIRQIIYGTIDAALEPLFQFEHGASAIADVIGTRLETDVLMEAKEDFWEEVNIAIGECRKLSLVSATEWPTLDEVLTRGPLLDIPLASLRLGTGYLTASEVQNADSAIPQQVELPPEIMDPLTWPDDALEAVQGYRDWISTAAELGLGLFFHR
jgi:hypothetical protein